MECNILDINDHETNMEVPLHRNNVEPQPILRTDQDVEEDDFINDNYSDVSQNEKSEEDLYEDNDGEESDTSC